MAKWASLQSGVIIGARDCSSDLLSIDPKFSRTLHSATSLADADKKAAGGLFECGYSAEGYYNDSNGFVQQLTDALTNPASGSGITSAFPGNATSIGAAGVVLPDGLIKMVGDPLKVDNLVMVQFEMQSNGKPGLTAKLLHPLGTESATGSSTYFDRGASSANGGMANLHVTAVTGVNPATIKVQHSTDHSVWVDLITFAAVSAAGAQSLQVAGTVNRYIRANFTIGAASSDTFILSFSGF
jgi:hypothetical protein